MQVTALQELVPLPAYRESRQHVFPSAGSLEWYVRSHKVTLVEQGALVLIGRTWRAHAERFDAAVLSIASSAAAAHLALAKAG